MDSQHQRLAFQPLVCQPAPFRPASVHRQRDSPRRRLPVFRPDWPLAFRRLGRRAAKRISSIGGLFGRDDCRRSDNRWNTRRRNSRRGRAVWSGGRRSDRGYRRSGRSRGQFGRLCSRCAAKRIDRIRSFHRSLARRRFRGRRARGRFSGNRCRRIHARRISCRWWGHDFRIVPQQNRLTRSLLSINVLLLLLLTLERDGAGMFAEILDRQPSRSLNPLERQPDTVSTASIGRFERGALFEIGAGVGLAAQSHLGQTAIIVDPRIASSVMGSDRQQIVGPGKVAAKIGVHPVADQLLQNRLVGPRRSAMRRIAHKARGQQKRSSNEESFP